MADPVVAQTAPYPVELEAGKKYAWCACGRSAQQPFCDGSHKGTGLAPMITTVAKTDTYWLCGCKRSKEPPFCDGSHESL